MKKKNRCDRLKIAFFLGSEVDEVIVTTFAKQLLSPSVYVNTITMGLDLAAFHATYGVIIDLLPRDYQHFFILFEALSSDEDQISEIRNIIARPIQEYGLLHYVTFCPIVPNLNSWLLGKYQLPAKRFGQKFDLSTIKKVAGSIDINVLKRENASFKHFVEALRSYTQQQDLRLKEAA
jgi:hypothetical protein